jgi:hypothetical protein
LESLRFAALETVAARAAPRQKIQGPVMKTRLAIAVLLLAPLARALLAQEPCADVRASDVAARIDGIGDETRCGIGIVLFGFKIGLLGPKCPKDRFIYPAHQECQGEKNVGTSCSADQDVEVRQEKCECVVIGILHTGLALPSCTCTPNGTGGTIEDAKTTNCAPQ